MLELTMMDDSGEIHAVESSEVKFGSCFSGKEYVSLGFQYFDIYYHGLLADDWCNRSVPFSFIANRPSEFSFDIYNILDQR